MRKLEKMKKISVRELIAFIIGFIFATILLHILFSYGLAHIFEYINIDNVVVSINETKMVDHMLTYVNST